MFRCIMYSGENMLVVLYDKCIFTSDKLNMPDHGGN